MPSLADTQAALRHAVIASDVDAVASILGGNSQAVGRVAIHQRHYRASLVDTLVNRFPATAWLIGGTALSTAAAAFVVDQPPTVLCMAEFGDTFPAYLGSRPGLERVPYLASFASLEWEVGRVSVAVSAPAADLNWLRSLDAESLGARSLTLQPGLAYLHASTDVDTLLNVYLSGDPPGEFLMAEGDRWIEVVGARGNVAVHTLPPAHWHFRRALAAGASIEAAATVALDHDDTFDPGQALVQLFAAHMVTYDPD